MEHSEQILRIREKLKTGQELDRKFEVFGAKSHRYKIGNPVAEAVIEKFEEKYEVILPSCYRSFVLQIGNGGPGEYGSGAGPFYGIFPFGEGVHEIVEGEFRLDQAGFLDPGMTDENWNSVVKRLRDDSISDEEYEAELARIYSGVLPIGSQGCTYCHALILSGPFRGRVVNVDLGLQRPRFCFENNFLDWYERWLDEVIAGTLISDNPTWFGYTMGGNDVEVMAAFDQAKSVEERVEALKGLAKLSEATTTSCETLLALCESEQSKIRHLALESLTRFSFSMARTPLRLHIQGSDEDCLIACQAIRQGAEKFCNEWVESLRNRLPRVKSAETYQQIAFLFCDMDPENAKYLIEYRKNQNEEVRAMTYYSMGELRNKRKYLREFGEGLDDSSPRVVHAALQALDGVKDDRLLPYYDRIIERFPTDKYYVLTNLRLRLGELGYDLVDGVRISLPKRFWRRIFGGSR